MVETLSELLENAANVAEDNGGSYKEEDYLHLGTSYLDHNTWLIAAPYDTMENNIRIEIFSKAEEDRKRRLEDPIVFRATKVGIVIVSMWGEEASGSSQPCQADYSYIRT